MQTIFTGTLLSCYGQAYVQFKNTFDQGQDHRRGQVNGILGAAVPTILFLTFGLHTGDVYLTLKVAQEPPPVDDSWEEIVEASFTMPAQVELGLRDWDGTFGNPFPLLQAVIGTLHGHQFGQRAEGRRARCAGTAPERYELTLGQRQNFR
ncbi:MAG: hypothetical protein IPG42_16505 [Betaproteobacteria bacterium]|nr:hypothetical protein [Betaproteobacteria bacterium]